MTRSGEVMTSTERPKPFIKQSNDPDEVLRKIAMPLISWSPEKATVLGTAVVIGPGLAIMAKHVFEEIIEQFGATDAEGYTEVNCGLYLYQSRGQGKAPALWSVHTPYPSPTTDITFLQFQPTDDNDSDYEWGTIPLRLTPPPVGAQVAAFGYHKGEKGEHPILTSSTALGYVVEQHELKRDSVMLPFPCYQINTPVKGGMSGGPVFYQETGELCGIICTNIEAPVVEGEEAVSYVASLWPALATSININREGHPPDVWYPVLDLFRDGFLEANGSEHVQISIGTDGRPQIGIDDVLNSL